MQPAYRNWAIVGTLLCGTIAGACSPSPAGPSQFRTAAPTTVESVTMSESRITTQAAGVAPEDSEAQEGALVAQLRQASARFHRIQVALDEGYVQSSPGCTPGFGIVFRNNALVDGVVDPEHPELLLYEPQENGRMRLVAVEFLVLAAAWDSIYSDSPTYAGYEFEDRRAPGSPGPPFPNYALHAWIWKHNPNGVFTHTAPNPTIICEVAS
jgi:hypothetical protein